MKYMNIIYGTIVDGPGLRNSIYLSGCKHGCKGCHNPSSWSFEAGKYFSDRVLRDFINRTNMDLGVQGVTISGGDPFSQNLDELWWLVATMYIEGIRDITVYTGYTFEELLEMGPTALRILELIKTLVDGRYVEELKCHDKKFIGSSNQRIINVSETLKTGTIKLRRY